MRRDGLRMIQWFGYTLSKVPRITEALLQISTNDKCDAPIFFVAFL